MIRLIERPDGIAFSVPRNFPKPVFINETGREIISFNIQPHEKSQRFFHFFEVVISPVKIDFLKLIPVQGYEPKETTEENIIINGHDAVLKTTNLLITHPCGSKAAAKLYALEYRSETKGKYIGFLTFTMTKKGFIDIVKTIKCR